MVCKRCVIVLAVLTLFQCIEGLFDFPTNSTSVPKQDVDLLSKIDDDKLRTYIEISSLPISQSSPLENNLANSGITVRNGSVSHVQFLETLPEIEAKYEHEIARKIVKASEWIYNSECIQKNIAPQSCRDFFSEKPLPNSHLSDECVKILRSERDGHHPFRRLLQSHYKDGFYEMFPSNKLPFPRTISRELRNFDQGDVKSLHKNVVLAAWAQFIEHDLSKTVSTTMKSGTPIECCNSENFKLLPRYRHPACAPLIGFNNSFGRESCLNYVRSALAVGSKCNFGPGEQVNQATWYLDLSQLYGYTKKSQRRMRTFRNGRLKSTVLENSQGELLPMAKEDINLFCVAILASDDACFMAGDSRVNSNPFSIVVYTIFLRSHNRIAAKIKNQHPDWDDEILYKTAKSINIAIYRRIVFKEWLSSVLGDSIASLVNAEHLSRTTENSKEINKYLVSNEFAIAAIRFYLSMLPDVLKRYAQHSDLNEIHPTSGNDRVDDLFNIFLLKDQIYRPSSILSNKNKINEILNSMLHQHAMRMDSNYVESLAEEHNSYKKLNRSDILAFDIQRGRDHGLQGYVKYLEICENTTITEWKDLERYIRMEDVNNLKSIYGNLDDIDLIVGGISETLAKASTVGPTFSCILGEQFSKIRQWQGKMDREVPSSASEIALSYKDWNAAKLICENAELHDIPKNVFEIPSEKNPLISCAKLLNS